MKMLKLAILASAGGLIAGCAPQAPARVVSGYGQNTSSLMPMVQREVVAQPQARAATQHASRTLSEESLATISPAAGDIVPAKRLAVAPKPVAATPVEVELTMVQHRVTATDTGYKLARTYNTSVDRILKDNGLKSIADIREGQDLTIAQNSKPQISAWDEMKRALTEKPVAQAPIATQQVAQKVELVEPAQIAVVHEDAKLASIEPAAGERPKDDGMGYEKYTVQPKDTIYRISLKYNVSVLDIMATNDFAEPQDLKSGFVIKVPVRKAVPGTLVATKEVTNAEVAPAAGSDVAMTASGEPMQVAMLTNPATVSDLDSKAVKQQAQKAAVMTAPKDSPLSKDEAKNAEEKRGYVDSAAAHSKGLVWPVRGEIVRRFGDDGSGVARTGINIAVPKGTPVLASEGGTVLYADDGLKIYGKMVLVRHDNGMVSAYAHNSYLLVRKNERVKKGQVVALSGASGNVESPQLHFELRQHASAVDPIAMLPRL